MVTNLLSGHLRVVVHPLEHLLRWLHVPSCRIWWHLWGIDGSWLWSIFLLLGYWVITKGVFRRSHGMLWLLGVARLWLLLYVALGGQKLIT